LYHIHAHAASGKLGYFIRSGQAGLENQGESFGIVQAIGIGF
jgi:hypothetical protein